MVNPQFEELQPATLAEVKGIVGKIEKRDAELNYRTGKVKDFLDNFTEILSNTKKEELFKKLIDLKLTRLKAEHICKIIDFLPENEEDLKVILLSYPLSLPKKDQTAIIGVVKDFA